MPQPFDIHKAKSGVPVITRDGRKVKILSYEAEGPTPIVFQIPEIDKHVRTSYKNGGYNYNKMDDAFDLMHPDEEMYVNLYTSIVEPLYIYESIEAAKSGRADGLLKCKGTYKLVKVE